MATKVVNNQSSTRKRAHLPAKMGGRNYEVRAVGAWVEPEPFHRYGLHEAVLSAQVEEENIMRRQQQKEAKLKQFQNEVKRRVKTLESIKRQQQLERSYKAVEVERNVVRQSASAAERSTPRKNRCSLRDSNDLTIKQSGTITNLHSCIHTDSETEDDKIKAFQEQNNQVRMFSRQARHKLRSHQIMTENFQRDDLPGGVWKMGSTLDHPSSRSMIETDVIDLEDEQYEGQVQEEAKDQTRLKYVHFDLDPHYQDNRRERIARKSASEILGSQIQRVPDVPSIYPGVESEEDKQRAINQRAMYRRLFMDIEREQVKENIRRKQHRKRIHQLKKEKENERQRIEDVALEVVAPKDPVTGETPSEALRRERIEEASMHASMEQCRKRQQKHVETERYLDALKCGIREKVEQSGIDLPSLCCCGATVWETNPDTCANNCVFYKNPKAYAKALQSLLVSCDVV